MKLAGKYLVGLDLSSKPDVVAMYCVPVEGNRPRFEKAFSITREEFARIMDELEHKARKRAAEAAATKP